MRYLSLLLALLLPTLVLAQVQADGDDPRASHGTVSSIEHSDGHVLLTPDAPVAVSDFFPAPLDEGPRAARGTFAKTLRTDAHSSWTEKSMTGSEEPSALTHHRFAQAIDDIPVLGATLILHAKQGEVQFVTGKSYPRQATTATANLSKSEATRQAIIAFTAWSKRQRLHPLETDVTGKPLRVDGTSNDIALSAESPRLVYVDRQYPNYTGSLVLAYEVEIGPGVSHRAMYLDANNGKLITSIPLVAHNTVPGTVETGYYGTQNVMVDQVGANSYRLVDSTRGVIVLNSQNQEINSTSSAFGLLAGDKGGMANDVFYGSSRFYDLLKDKFGWLGVDGQGEFFLSTVANTDGDLVNAFWSGERATFGGGSCHFDPLTTMDVVGHEFAHGITQRTSALIYAGQSGALNEGMSDIYGKALELYEQPGQFTWTLGNRFADSEYAKPFRSMEDPNIYNKPKAVGGSFWNDGAGVHTNSGPLGHWFYLLVEGGSGTNDLGTAYNVQSVGLDIAFNVAFQLNRDYLTETSGYQDAFTNCMVLVETLYGASSSTYTSFAEAWKAIGLPTSGGGPTTGPDLTIYSFNSNNPRYCHPVDSVELTVVLANRGDDVSAGTSYTLTATLDTETSTVTRTFDEDFLGGEIEFIDIMFPMSVTPGQYRAEVTVDLTGDIDPDNDSGSQTAYVLQAPHVIEIDGFNIEELDCFATEREIYVNLLNRGCETFDGPVVIDLFDADSMVVKTINAGNITLPPNELKFVSFTVAYTELEGAVGMRYDVPNDPLPEDNIVSADLGRPRLLTAANRIDFSTANANRYVALDDSRGHLGTINQASHDWLGTTGYYTTPFRLACLETESNIEVAFDLSNVELCVDFENEANPKLAFDMKQLHGEGDPNYQGLVEANRGLSISTPQIAVPDVYLDSRPDGITTSEEIELPANHKGLVRFTIFNAAGSPTNWESADPDFEDYDYTFIDNIRLAGVVGTRELNAEYSILPNPARSYFTVNTTSLEPLLVEVVNSIGVLVTSQSLLSTHTFSTGNWPNGLYQVRISDALGAQSTETLMVAK
ncbi:MAG: M4 family metallopeptidase [Saprospiraceae bacterium]